MTKHRTKGFFHFQKKKIQKQPCFWKANVTWVTEKGWTLKPWEWLSDSCKTFRTPLYGWLARVEFFPGQQSPSKADGVKDYSEKLLLCRCQVRASDNAELDDASFMLLSYEGYEFHNVKSSVWHTSTFFPTPFSEIQEERCTKSRNVSWITPHHKSFVYQTKEDSYIHLCRVKCNSKLKHFFYLNA